MVLICDSFFFDSTAFKPDFSTYNKEEHASYQLTASQLQIHPSLPACDTEIFSLASWHNVDFVNRGHMRDPERGRFSPPGSGVLIFPAPVALGW